MDTIILDDEDTTTSTTDFEDVKDPIIVPVRWKENQHCTDVATKDAKVSSLASTETSGYQNPTVVPLANLVTAVRSQDAASNSTCIKPGNLVPTLNQYVVVDDKESVLIQMLVRENKSPTAELNHTQGKEEVRKMRKEEEMIEGQDGEIKRKLQEVECEDEIKKKLPKVEAEKNEMITKLETELKRMKKENESLKHRVTYLEKQVEHENSVKELKIWDFQVMLKSFKTPIIPYLKEAIAKRNWDECREILVNNLVDVNSELNAEFDKIRNDSNIFMAAAREGLINLMILYNRHDFPINLKFDDNNSLLYVAVVNKKVELIKLLLFLGASVNHRDMSSATIIHVAVTNGNMEILKTLLMNAPGSANIEDRNGCTPLHYAAISGNVAAVKCLLNYNCDKTQQDHYGRTAIDFATEYEHKAVVEALLTD